MALTPQNEDAFFREVDEELRRDRLGNFWRNYGRVLIGLVIVGLAAFGGYLWWQAERQKAAGVAGEELAAAIDALNAGKTSEADAKLKVLASGKQDGYRALAQLTQAARKLQSGDDKGAASQYMEIASDKTIAEPLRDVALIRATAAAFETLPPKTVIDRLAPLAKPGNAWFGTAGEMTAVSWIKLNQPQKASAIFAEIAKDKQVPESLRARAVRISGALDAGAGTSSAEPRKEKSE